MACCCASDGDSPEVPVTGGARLKSGGTTSGALRAAVDSALGLRRFRNDAQPLVATSVTRTRAVRLLRMFDSLLGPLALCVILTSEERAQQQDHDGDANRRIADIEYQKRAELAEMKVGEVDHIAEAGAVEDITERSTEHHAERRVG